MKNKENKNFQNKIVLVTGAAQGIGKSIAEAFYNGGATVVFTDLELNKVSKTIEDFKNDNAIAMQLDVTSEKDWLQTTKEIEKLYGKLDVLINNAGIGTPVEFSDLSLNTWNQMLAVNATSVFLGCKLCLPLLSKSEHGAIVNIASIFGSRPRTNAIHYCASKAAVLSLNKNFAMYLTENSYNIRCNAIQPGVIRTSMMEAAIDASPNPEELLSSFENLHPMGKIGETSDVAEAALFLASDNAKFITGTSLAVDGGFLSA